MCSDIRTPLWLGGSTGRKKTQTIRTTVFSYLCWKDELVKEETHAVKTTLHPLELLHFLTRTASPFVQVPLCPFSVSPTLFTSHSPCQRNNSYSSLHSINSVSSALSCSLCIHLLLRHRTGLTQLFSKLFTCIIVCSSRICFMRKRNLATELQKLF
jgi:hypothetical protein